MAESTHEFEQFSNREGFNRSLSHFKAVSGLLEDFEDEYNLADILNALLSDKDIEQDQLSPILYALLVDKYGYITGSYNMESTLDDFEYVKTEVRTWKAVDVVVAYHHPELGFTVINPKNPAHLDSLQDIRKNELVTIYAGAFSEGTSGKVADKAIETFIRFLEGRKIKSPQALLSGSFTFEPFDYEDDDEEADESISGRAPAERPRSRREPIRASASESGYSDEETDESDESSETSAEPSQSAAPAPPPSPDPAATGSRRMTPMYSVPVTNELFHNGNVEAWKKIIQSYQASYKACEVLVFYEGERIHDINTLFKWGKVKHGSTILFAVVGEEIKDVAKLQRYFRQGASSQFEAFLKAPVNSVLKLF